jgi:hypothetical protein
MTTLEATQRWMHEAVVRAGGSVPAAMFVSGPLGAAEGLAIYQRGYFLRIAACMREQFPALCHALGQMLFDDFVADYIRDMPPESHTLYDLGRRFADWMEANRPDAAAPEAWVDFMIDLARFEYAVFAMFDAPGHEGKALAGPDTPDAALRLQPAFALGAYRFPVAEYYHAVRRGEAPEVPPALASFVALVRTDYVTRTIPLSETHHVFLRAMGSVEDGIAAVVARMDIPDAQVRASWGSEDGIRARWIAWGFFV